MKEVKIEPLKLEAGCTYVIECDFILSATRSARIRRDLHEQTAGKAISFVLLDGGMKLLKTDNRPKDKEFFKPNFKHNFE